MDGSRVHLTELEAAFGFAGARGAILHRNTALDETERLRRCVKGYRVQLDKMQRRERARDKSWVPSPDDCLAVLRIVQAAEKAVALEERLRKLQIAERKGYTPEQLAAVWRHHLRRAASEASPEDAWAWAAIRYGEGPADVLEPEGRKK